MQAVARAFFHVPVVGWLLKDAVCGLPDAKYYFAFNLVVVFWAMVYFFGYPLLIVSALMSTATMLVFLVFLTAADMFTRLGRKITAR